MVKIILKQYSLTIRLWLANDAANLITAPAGLQVNSIACLGPEQHMSLVGWFALVVEFFEAPLRK
jgi:hypothetical protein